MLLDDLTNIMSEAHSVKSFNVTWIICFSFIDHHINNTGQTDIHRGDNTQLHNRYNQTVSNTVGVSLRELLNPDYTSCVFITRYHDIILLTWLY